MVKALVFDVFGTVVDWRSSIARAAQALLEPQGINIDWAQFADRWREGYFPAMRPVWNGERPYVILDVLHREILDAMLGGFGLEALGDAERATLTQAWHALDPWPDSVAGLTRLKAQFVIAPLSNGHVAMMVAMAKRAGLPWDLILGAEIAGSYKPDPRVYDSAPRLLGLAPAGVMMVAAHPQDLAAAAKRGLKTAYVHRPLEYGAAAAKDRPAAGSFDVMVDSFEELAEKLGV